MVKKLNQESQFFSAVRTACSRNELLSRRMKLFTRFTILLIFRFGSLFSSSTMDLMLSNLVGERMRRKKRLACELTWRISKGFGLVSVDWFLSTSFLSDERTVEREAELIERQKDKQSNGLIAERATKRTAKRTAKRRLTGRSASHPTNS